MMPCIGHHSDINRSWLCRWFMLIKSGTLFTVIRYCIFDTQNFNLYFRTMNATETNIIEDDRRIIPMKEITKDWLLISISIIIIGKSANRDLWREKVRIGLCWDDLFISPTLSETGIDKLPLVNHGPTNFVVKYPLRRQNKNPCLIRIKFACWL